jgi:hypothetical protein
MTVYTGQDSGTGDVWYFTLGQNNGYNSILGFNGHGSFGGDSILGEVLWTDLDMSSGDQTAAILDAPQVGGYYWTRWTVRAGTSGSPSGYGIAMVMGQGGIKVTGNVNDFSGANGAFDVEGDFYVAGNSNLGSGNFIIDGSGNVTQYGGINNLYGDGMTPANGSNDPNVIDYLHILKNGVDFYIPLYQ